MAEWRCNCQCLGPRPETVTRCLTCGAERPQDSHAEIVGPFSEYRLVVDGYSVPFVEAREDDGGTVTFIIDNRLAWTVPAGAFEDVAHLVATAYALGIGLPCAPSADGVVPTMENVPAVMRPRRALEILSVSPDLDA